MQPSELPHQPSRGIGDGCHVLGGLSFIPGFGILAPEVGMPGGSQIGLLKQQVH